MFLALVRGTGKSLLATKIKKYIFLLHECDILCVIFHVGIRALIPDGPLLLHLLFFLLPRNRLVSLILLCSICEYVVFIPVEKRHYK